MKERRFSESFHNIVLMQNRSIAAILLAGILFSTCKKDEFSEADALRINQMQVIGSHNSYRLKTYEPIFNALQGIAALLPAGYNPDELDYTHLPLDRQFSDYGIRQIELDIYYDPNGGLFYNRVGNQLVGEPVESGFPELNQPGFKVLHIPDIDYETNYLTFKQALQAVKDWSDAHPHHLPIFIMIETKEDALAGVAPPIYAWTAALPFDAAAMDALDQEIKDVFGANLENVITPDDVRGEFTTLNEAITTSGWPRIGDSRGKVGFFLDNNGAAKDFYLQGHPSLQGRILFTNSGTGNPESAVIIENNSKEPNIKQWVQQGYLIRTRADAGTTEARTGDVSSRDSAFASGAQFISTDYYRPDPRYPTDTAWTDYSVRLPNNEVARVNPISGPAGFSGGRFE